MSVDATLFRVIGMGTLIGTVKFTIYLKAIYVADKSQFCNDGEYSKSARILVV